MTLEFRIHRKLQSEILPRCNLWNIGGPRNGQRCGELATVPITPPGSTKVELVCEPHAGELARLATVANVLAERQAQP